MPSRTPLTDWMLTLVGQTPEFTTTEPVAATVPGSVHTDLLAAGLIPDPYLDDNELVVDWVGRQTWRYETSFDWTLRDDTRVDLACDGLDTVATIELNGTRIATTANMHRRYRFDLAGALVDGDNVLTITFASGWDAAEAARDLHGDLPNAYPTPFNFLRKMACSFGWDWGLTTVTAGIWRPIALEEWSVARLSSVRPDATADGAAHFVVAVAGDTAGLSVTATVDGVSATASASPSTTLDLKVADPDVWWPIGLGDQPLSEAVVVLTGADGAELDRWSKRIGFRTVRLNTTPDADGTPFEISVNGLAVPIRGANWIPDDAFPHRVDRERLETRIGQAAGANVNLLRVWGGGVYESDEFYDVCDETGMLVWQDFLFACAAYPEEEPLRSEVLAEAEDNVARLMPHPSLVLWNGNNENIWGHEDWDWAAELGDRTWGLGYYLELLPEVVARIDPSRPYWPGSPYSGTTELHPNDPAHALTHIWDVWNQRDYTAYADYRPRFASEFGWQGPPTWSTLVRSVHDDPLRPDSPGVMHHQKAADGNGKLARGLEPHLPAPTDMTDWHFTTQLNQAKAIRFGVEHLRSLRPLNQGAIVWQLNDCWPVTSWAAIDGDGRLKPLWYALRSAFATRLLTIQPRDGGLAVVAVTDDRATWQETVTIERRSFDGVVLASSTASVVVSGFGAATLGIPAAVAIPGDPTRELLVATTASGIRAQYCFAEDRDLALEPADLEVSTSRSGEETIVSVTAQNLVRELCLFPDRIVPEAEASDCLVTLLPGESREFKVTGLGDADATALASYPVLRSVNDLVAGRKTALAE